MQMTLEDFQSCTVYRQNVLLGLAMRQLPAYLNLYERYMNDIESSGQLNRALEFLPDASELLKRKVSGGKGLTRPELAVLLAYSKQLLKREILTTDLFDHDYVNRYVAAAFPAPLAKRFASGAPRAMDDLAELKSRERQSREVCIMCGEVP